MRTLMYSRRTKQHMHPLHQQQNLCNISVLYIENKTLNNLWEKKLTLFLDESTDNSNRSQASLMARWVDEGCVFEEYLGLNELKGTKAADFEEAVSPLSLYVSCRNHKLALCFTHLVKNNETMTAVEDLLISIWKLFTFSAKRSAVYKSTQQVYDQEPLTSIRAAATRWLSHFKACESFISRYESILNTLDALDKERADAEVRGICDRATSQKLVYIILLLNDLLKPVEVLNLYLQSDKGFFTNLNETVQACTESLGMLITAYRSGMYDGLEFRSRKVNRVTSV
ncbi:uncharacterized protein LOC128206563 [Mya arenaria]|uniref:uncharacterized protein LOC128206563 n=1 Tax=Mya arenaria TaxID=6604 RepID=UPI0022E31337|nr:uncharacterized protein LOC128206563 [Mya arenaria]XP_052765084.1 uncharacterized protein LOC128206563 [Mya arenaria]